MDANLVVIDSDAELRRARALVERLIGSDNPEEQAQLTAQAHLIAAYEQEKWPRRAPGASGIIRYLIDQHSLTKADLRSLLGSQAKDVLSGEKPLTMAMVQRLRARFHVSADLLLPTPMPKPAVPPVKSITSDYLICLEDGRKLKMLKRHLRRAFNLTPEEYRNKWELPADYPMVAPNHSRRTANGAGRGPAPRAARGGKTKR